MKTNQIPVIFFSKIVNLWSVINQLPLLAAGYNFRPMRKLFLLAFLFFVLNAKSQTLTPRQQFPGLFEAVQTSTIFPDNKTFVDATPKQDPALIMKAYNEQKDQPGFNLADICIGQF